MSILIHESLITDLLSNPALKKSDARTILFLLHKPGALSSDELAAGVGVSKKSASKSIKRLTAAGLIQPGEFQAKRRTLDISSLEQMEPKEVTEGTIKESLETLAEKVGRLESVIGSLTTALEAVLNPAPSYDGQNMTGTGHIQATANPDSTIDVNGQGANVTGTATAQAIEKTGEPIQAIMVLENIPNESKAVSVITEQGTNEPQKDTINDDLDDAIKYAGARLAALKATALLKEKAANSSLSSTCAPTSTDAEFEKLFGVHVPPGFTDTAAVETMIARRKAGKLDNVKSPLAYLGSIAGKVQPIVATSRQSNPEIQMPVKPTAGISFSSVNVEPPRLPHADIDRINSLWDAITDKAPYEATALPKFEQQVGKYKIPLHILAKSVFNAEQLKASGQLG